MKIIANTGSKKIAQFFVLFMQNKGKHINGNSKSLGNTRVSKENDVISLIVSGKSVITATPDANTGEYTYLLEPRNSSALNRIVAIQESLNWQFQLTWFRQSAHLLIGEEAIKENLIPIGALSKRTVKELEEMTLAKQNLAEEILGS